jgi:hypothetical protein
MVAVRTRQKCITVYKELHLEQPVYRCFYVSRHKVRQNIIYVSSILNSRVHAINATFVDLRLTSHEMKPYTEACDFNINTFSPF